ncbi:MAG: hypothetical protein IKC43_02155 [Clostridia bacterium]|nr:hypothetical protein [Clostridia bacterium]
MLDGTGADVYLADVAVFDGKIFRIGKGPSGRWLMPRISSDQQRHRAFEYQNEKSFMSRGFARQSKDALPCSFIFAALTKNKENDILWASCLD